MSELSAVDQYLERHALREVELAERVDGTFSHALIVPARNESVRLLEGYRALARRADRLLVVLVVNGSVGEPAAVQERNRALLGELSAWGGRRELGLSSFQLKDRDFSLICIDRASDGVRFFAKQGVGVARRMGMDLALALWRTGRIESPWMGSTDADATLPASYFERVPAPGCVAVVHPFVHLGTTDDALAHAHRCYEIYLRYYVLGLGSAGSPYAFHTIGSCLTVLASAYAKVRGFPRRLAGEDFYLLGKLAKLGPIERGGGDPIRIVARVSDRTPFGTGPAAQQLLARPESLRLPDPRVFTRLGAVIGALDQFATEGHFPQLTRGLSALGPRAVQSLDLPRFVAKVSALAREAPTPRDLRWRLHTLFDALRTLRLVHGLRDGGLPDRDFREALAAAPFAPGVDASSAVPEILARLQDLESRAVGPLGPSIH